MVCGHSRLVEQPLGLLLQTDRPIGHHPFRINCSLVAPQEPSRVGNRFWPRALALGSSGISRAATRLSDMDRTIVWLPRGRGSGLPNSEGNVRSCSIQRLAPHGSNDTSVLVPASGTVAPIRETSAETLAGIVVAPRRSNPSRPRRSARRSGGQFDTGTAGREGDYVAARASMGVIQLPRPPIKLRPAGEPSARRRPADRADSRACGGCV